MNLRKFLLNISIFSMKYKIRSSAESEDGSISVGYLSREETVLHSHLGEWGSEWIEGE